ncbi:hypothetical protein QR66_18370 [Chromobacterium piscinae]|nr:hypothetical protein QR66_18370 [Chromobacterium piscinae]
MVAASRVSTKGRDGYSANVQKEAIMPNTTEPSTILPAESGQAADHSQPLTLPHFLQIRSDGFFVLPDAVGSASNFRQAIDHLFSAGYYLYGLDYDLLCYYLYDFDPAHPAVTQPHCIAQCVLPFLAERQVLYRGLIRAEAGIEYLFEQLYLTQTVEVPVYGRDASGQAVVVGRREEIQTIVTQLEFDELVAFMWRQGVRFGLHQAVIKSILEQHKTGRYLIATPRAPVPGVDAGVQEQTAEIHRDDHPRKLAGGRVDLTQFQNRYPQIKARTVLLMKTPCRPGRPGRTLSGGIIHVPEPFDFDLGTLAGSGTEVQIDKEGHELIVAIRDGFLNIDGETNQISIVDKIIGREGVSVRTTGDLALQGDEYEEHGEVQERRVVTGKNLTMLNNVYGTVRSTGGRILLKQNLVGGAAHNDAGPICVEGLVSNAQVRAEQGEVTIARAENAIVIGQRVNIVEAKSCTILADEVDIQQASGCAIAAKLVHIGKAGARADQETAICMLLPDLSGFGRRLEAIQQQEQEGLHKLETVKKALALLTQEDELKRYFGIVARVKKGELQLSPEQQASLKRKSEQLAPKIKQISQLNAGMRTMQDAQSFVRAQAEELAKAREAAAAGIQCKLEEITGETVVRALTLPSGAPGLSTLSVEALRTRLRTSDAQTKTLFSDQNGCFSWQYSIRFTPL